MKVPKLAHFKSKCCWATFSIGSDVFLFAFSFTNPWSQTPCYSVLSPHLKNVCVYTRGTKNKSQNVIQRDKESKHVWNMRKPVKWSTIHAHYPSHVAVWWMILHHPRTPTPGQAKETPIRWFQRTEDTLRSWHCHCPHWGQHTTGAVQTNSTWLVFEPGK